MFRNRKLRSIDGIIITALQCRHYHQSAGSFGLELTALSQSSFSEPSVAPSVPTKGGFKPAPTQAGAGLNPPFGLAKWWGGEKGDLGGSSFLVGLERLFVLGGNHPFAWLLHLRQGRKPDGQDRVSGLGSRRPGPIRRMRIGGAQRCLIASLQTKIQTHLLHVEKRFFHPARPLACENSSAAVSPQ